MSQKDIARSFGCPSDKQSGSKPARALCTGCRSRSMSLPYILNWAIEGFQLWQREGLREPASVLHATSSYRKESDQLARFIEECCVVGEYARVKAASLYSTYQQ